MAKPAASIPTSAHDDLPELLQGGGADGTRIASVHPAGQTDAALFVFEGVDAIDEDGGRTLESSAQGGFVAVDELVGDRGIQALRSKCR